MTNTILKLGIAGALLALGDDNVNYPKPPICPMP